MCFLATVHMDRQDPVELRRYVEGQMARLGCDRLVKKRWHVPEARVEKGLQKRIGVGALIWGRDGRILLVRHHPDTGWDPDMWFTPGGAIEEGELPEDAIRREVMEEVGVEVEVLRLHRVNNEVLVHGEKEADTYFFQFDVMVTGGRPAPRPGEIIEARWFHKLPGTMAFREDYVEAFEAHSRDILPRMN